MSELSEIHRSLIGQANGTEEINDAWTTDGYTPTRNEKSYDSSFAEVLKSGGYRSIAQFLERRKEKGLSTHCLDLMGSAIYPRAAGHIDSAIGVRIKNSDEYLKGQALLNYPNSVGDINEVFGHNNRHIVEGNVFSRRTVRSIERTMKEMGISGFDLITCRPDGPFRKHTTEKTIAEDEDSIAAYYAVQLQRYATLLNEGGVMLIQVPQRESLYSRLDGLSELLEEETCNHEVFNSDYPSDSKVLLVKKLQT
ncbi:hypothetical protein OAL67_01105 [bacterium]|nr:hypothetical protein [bacterium]